MNSLKPVNDFLYITIIIIIESWLLPTRAVAP